MGRNTVRRDPVFSSRRADNQTSEAVEVMATTIKNEATAWEEELDELAELIRSVEADETAEASVRSPARTQGQPVADTPAAVPLDDPDYNSDDEIDEVEEYADVEAIPEILLPEAEAADEVSLEEDEDHGEDLSSLEAPDDGELSEEKPVDGKNLLTALDAVEASLNREDENDYVVRAIDAMETRLISHVDSVVAQLDSTRSDLSQEVTDLSRKVAALNSDIDALRSRTKGLPGRFFSVLMALVTAGAVFALLSYSPQDTSGPSVGGLSSDTAAVGLSGDEPALGDTITAAKQEGQAAGGAEEGGWSVQQVATRIGDYAGQLRSYVETNILQSDTDPQTDQ